MPELSSRVTIRTYSDPVHAEVDRGFLVAGGIPAVVTGGSGNLGEGLNHAVVKLEVPSVERERAVVMLARRQPIVADTEVDEIDRCPKCAHEDISTYRPFAVWVLLPLLLPFVVVLLILVPLVPAALGLLRVRRWYCATCGHRWKDRRR